MNQFNKFYPGTKINSYVYSFVSAVDLSAIDETIPDKKFNIKKKYFVVSNQFWKHKNHLVVVRALAHLKSTGAIDFNIVFTGKQMDAVNQDYFLSVIDAVEKSNLSNDVHFLGFLDRNDQLSLMAGSMGVIQPSTFEGWSTVIEDAKSLNKQVFASAIDIHIEQLGEDGYFFKEHDFEDLAKLLSDYIEGIIQKEM
ncbi:MAG: glycosyltransferase [Crocinitomicaceae bacterium]|nr:glycosyltransferase [Crocinitomicaceae bacterium]